MASASRARARATTRTRSQSKSSAGSRAIASPVNPSDQPLPTMEVPRRPSGPCARVSRELLGFVIVVLTIVPAYAASRLTSPPVAPPEVAALSSLGAQSDWDLDSHIRDVAARYRVPERLVVAIIEVESEFDPQAVSRRGARGLMQLMPATAEILGVNDPFDPRENIEAGVRHLRGLMNHFNNNLPLALAAYNAGAGAVAKNRGIPPYRETRQYVSRILRRLDAGRVKTLDTNLRSRRV